MHILFSFALTVLLPKGSAGFMRGSTWCGAWKGELEDTAEILGETRIRTRPFKSGKLGSAVQISSLISQYSNIIKLEKQNQATRHLIFEIYA